MRKTHHARHAPCHPCPDMPATAASRGGRAQSPPFKSGGVSRSRTMRSRVACPPRGVFSRYACGRDREGRDALRDTRLTAPRRPLEPVPVLEGMDLAGVGSGGARRTPPPPAPYTRKGWPTLDTVVVCDSPLPVSPEGMGLVVSGAPGRPRARFGRPSSDVLGSRHVSFAQGKGSTWPPSRPRPSCSPGT